MDIRGFVPFTVVDYPGKLASTVFCGGCNMRCPYCHNSHLVLHPDRQPRHSEHEVLSLLANRIGKLEGVVVSGGEPCIQGPDLQAFLSRIKGMGFATKLDTNGTKPDVVGALLCDGLIDMLAVDVKNGPDRYAETSGVGRDWWPEVSETLRLAVATRIELEVRTTVHKRFHGEMDILRIRQELDTLGVGEWIVQRFVARGAIDKTLDEKSSWSREELSALVGQMKQTRLRPN